ncbi:type 2 lanthipeptide synthetase LanM family protein [Streptomyces sp. NPDC001380]|uniref:type 2 lanthipeptide synthetase LanM family protein n=1 Tax=Streptomyces sp. NPDC001380 TaxID=3364566 RepID=UPI00369380F1
MIDFSRPPAADPALRGWWRDGLSSAELPCLREPEWAAFATAALAAAPPAACLPVGDLPGLTGFRAVVAAFAEPAGARLPEALPGADVDLPSVREQFVDGLAGTLARQAARTLVLELNVARVKGQLSGDTPSERFRDFLVRAGSRDGLSTLVHEYPVLARLLAQTCVHAADALTELLTRFAEDRTEIVSTLLADADPGTLVSVRATTGDGHQSGRSTALLVFADGTRLVYKPRPLGAHRHFNQVVDWLNARPGTPGLRTVAVLERPGYGWLEYISRLPCDDQEQLERFYRRQGAWLALLYALDATDLHFENLIAHADHPVPVDVETLFHPPAPGTPDEDPSVLALRASVYRVGLLPHLVLGEDDTALDVSGLGGDAGAGTPRPAVAWADAGTDRMRLVRRAGAIAGAGNRPVVDGLEADPADHLEVLLDGFRTAHRAITAGREDLVGPQGLLRRFAEDEVRVVARSTQAYATLLDESTHPDVLRDRAARDDLLRLLETDALGEPGWPRLADQEVAELWNGDVPLFTTRPDSMDLWSGTGVRIPAALERPGLDRVVDKIRTLGPDDLRIQEWIIRAAMAGRWTGPAHRPVSPSPLKRPGRGRSTGAPDQALAPDRLLVAARVIGDRLVDAAHRGRNRVNWLGLELLGDRYWRLGPGGADLAHGYPGPALFLAQLAALTEEASYAETARRALLPVPQLLSRLTAQPDELRAVGTGAFAGLGGIAYTLARVSFLLDAPDLHGWVEQAATLTCAAAEAEADARIAAAEGGEPPSGVAAGAAGGLAALLAVHRFTGSTTAWRGARLQADQLVDRPLPAAPGFAAGAAGIGWALSRFAAAGGGDRHRCAGLAALRTAAASAVRPGIEPTWCQGLPGIALAISDSPAALADPELANVVTQAARKAAAHGTLPDHSLCHGESGVLELLDGLPDQWARTALDRRVNELVTALDRSGPRCAAPGALAVPGLLTGLSGIGLGLLRLGFPGRTASTLLLQVDSPAVVTTDTANTTGRNSRQ